MAKAKKAKRRAAASAKKAAKRSIARRPAARRSRQYGVIPVRLSRSGQVQILLLTSRGTGRWVVPKGWRMARRTPAGTAEREAFEEAGVKGALWSRRPIGSYSYSKPDQAHLGKIRVAIFLLHVEKQNQNWPESSERRTRWFSVPRAATLVKERELSRLLRTVPRLLKPLVQNR